MSVKRNMWWLLRMEEGANYFLHKQDAKKLHHEVTLQNVLPVIVAFFPLIKNGLSDRSYL